MIAKEKEAYSGDDERARYGHRQEEDVAFHLRRAFGDDPEVVIFNDLRLKHGEENAQIDHLVMHPFGFIIIESKSITGEVRVNAAGEWQRSYRGNWSGLKSPLRQAELQQDILKRLLIEHRARLMNKTLGLQGGFAGRQWKVLCAVSSNAIVHRDDMAKGVSAQVVKPEFLHEQVSGLIGARSMVKRALLFDTRPEFTKDELERVSEFLLKQDARSRRAHAVESVRREVSRRPQPAAKTPDAADSTASRWAVNEGSIRESDSKALANKDLANKDLGNNGAGYSTHGGNGIGDNFLGSNGRGEQERGRQERCKKRQGGDSNAVAVAIPAAAAVNEVKASAESVALPKAESGAETSAPSAEAPVGSPMPEACLASPQLSEHLDRITARLKASATTQAPPEVRVQCQKCQEKDALLGRYGPYGYYVKCRVCNANTSLKQGCPACEHHSVRLSKSGAVYSGQCPQCEHEFVIFRQPD
ncbi:MULTISPECIES: nuclease-related domain-containing protein [Cobetia]|uniref:nuclease-related domain-containing protein n=1 Tax=Cobetia TaxID=204286 RepID=UPI001582C6C6|nr:MULTISPECIES: nuclease-related domain-containing protein [Cobetia]MDI4660859.1 NERD domain-containing protein [Cobetia sp. BMC6]NUJ56988.1 NERD domain-containing protein [Cobetia marina]NVN56175.1 NERD domain-containing protein [bacterium Scap17]